MHLSNEKKYCIELATAKDAPIVRRLANAAYRELSDMGLNYTATYQDEAETLKRMNTGRCFLLKQDDKILGTILFYKENYFTKRNTAYVGQFAIWPEHKKQGLGSILMDYCEKLAKAEGFEGLQLDTAIPAQHLVNWYLKRGYQVVGEQHWEGKTYDSYIFEKELPMSPLRFLSAKKFFPNEDDLEKKVNLYNNLLIKNNIIGEFAADVKSERAVIKPH